MAQHIPDGRSRGQPLRRGKGFARAGGLVAPQVRKVGEGRGFAVTRLLTHWAEIVGPDVAQICRPLKVGYGRSGLGATLTVLARGAAAPMLQAQLPAIRDRVNACYGYSAISQIRITQTAPQGFSDGKPGNVPGPAVPAPPPPRATEAAKDVTADVRDPDLRAALAALGARVMSDDSD